MKIAMILMTTMAIMNIMIDDGNGDDIDDEDETIPMALCGIKNPRSIIPILLCKQRSLQHHARNKITKEIS